jgi:nitrate reductase gamma subunit
MDIKIALTLFCLSCIIGVVFHLGVVFVLNVFFVYMLKNGHIFEQITLVELQLAYSARDFLGTRSSKWTTVAALLRLSRNRNVLPAL